MTEKEKYIRIKKKKKKSLIYYVTNKSLFPVPLRPDLSKANPPRVL